MAMLGRQFATQTVEIVVTSSAINVVDRARFELIQLNFLRSGNLGLI